MRLIGWMMAGVMAVGTAGAQSVDPPSAHSRVADGWAIDVGAAYVTNDGAAMPGLQLGAVFAMKDPSNQLRLSLGYAWSGNGSLPQSYSMGCFDVCGASGKDKLLGATVSLRHYVSPSMGRAGAFIAGVGGLYVSHFEADYWVRNISTGIETTSTRSSTRSALGIGPGAGIAGSIAGVPLYAEVDFMYLTADRGSSGGSLAIPVTVGFRF